MDNGVPIDWVGGSAQESVNLEDSEEHECSSLSKQTGSSICKQLFSRQGRYCQCFRPLRHRPEQPRRRMWSGSRSGPTDMLCTLVPGCAARETMSMRRSLLRGRPARAPPVDPLLWFPCQ
ncbi:hypothetical protein BDL97_06G077900 [Sphagnum fallax]|nr:hypothetical protein BDL97_06G077900 [Sphagnum fallax]